jgi:hypothetical protein
MPHLTIKRPLIIYTIDKMILRLVLPAGHRFLIKMSFKSLIAILMLLPFPSRINFMSSKLMSLDLR